MQRDATSDDAGVAPSAEKIVVGGVTYVSASEVAEQAGVARQTLWRWRREGKVPRGYVYRDKQVLFTLADAQTVQAYAHRMQPADASPRPTKKRVQ